MRALLATICLGVALGVAVPVSAQGVPQSNPYDLLRATPPAVDRVVDTTAVPDFEGVRARYAGAIVTSYMGVMTVFAGSCLQLVALEDDGHDLMMTGSVAVSGGLVLMTSGSLRAARILNDAGVTVSRVPGSVSAFTLVTAHLIAFAAAGTGTVDALMVSGLFSATSIIAAAVQMREDRNAWWRYRNSSDITVLPTVGMGGAGVGVALRF